MPRATSQIRTALAAIAMTYAASALATAPAPAQAAEGVPGLDLPFVEPEDLSLTPSAYAADTERTPWRLIAELTAGQSGDFQSTATPAMVEHLLLSQTDGEYAWNTGKFEGVRPCKRLYFGERPIAFARYDGFTIIGHRDVRLPGLEDELDTIVAKIARTLDVVRESAPDLYDRFHAVVAETGGYIYLERCSGGSTALVTTIDDGRARTVLVGLSFLFASDSYGIDAAASALINALGRAEPFFSTGKPGTNQDAAALQIAFTKALGTLRDAQFASAFQTSFHQRTRRPPSELVDDVDEIKLRQPSDAPDETPWEMAERLSENLGETERGSVEPTVVGHVVNMPLDVMTEFGGNKECKIPQTEDDAPMRKYDGISVFGKTSKNIVDPSIDLGVGVNKIVDALGVLHDETPDLYARLRDALTQGRGFIFLETCPLAAGDLVMTRLIDADTERFAFIGLSSAIVFDRYNAYNVASVLLYALGRIEPFLATGEWGRPEDAYALQLQYAARVGEDKFLHSVGTTHATRFASKFRPPRQGLSNDVEYVFKKSGEPSSYDDSPWGVMQGLIAEHGRNARFEVPMEQARYLHFDGPIKNATSYGACRRSDYFVPTDAETVPVSVIEGIAVVGYPFLRYPDRTDQTDAFLARFERAIRLVQAKTPELFERWRATMSDNQFGYIRADNCMPRIGTLAFVKDHKVDGKPVFHMVVSTEFSSDLRTDHELALVLVHEMAHMEGLHLGINDKTEQTSWEVMMAFSDAVGDDSLMGRYGSTDATRLWGFSNLGLDGNYVSFHHF